MHRRPSLILKRNLRFGESPKNYIMIQEKIKSLKNELPSPNINLDHLDPKNWGIECVLERAAVLFCALRAPLLSPSPTQCQVGQNLALPMDFFGGGRKFRRLQAIIIDPLLMREKCSKIKILFIKSYFILNPFGTGVCVSII